MSKPEDIYLRAHTIVLNDPNPPKPHSRRVQVPAWPEIALVFDCESRTNIRQELTFGFYRVLKLYGNAYVLDEEGAFFDDDLPADERQRLEEYINKGVPDVASFPPRFPLHSRSEFVTNVFYHYARKGALIVGFNIGYDLGRLARKWPEGNRNEWSLVLSEYPDGNENLHHPRVLIEPIDAKKSFIRFRGEWLPKGGTAKRTKIHEARFLDLRTLLWALFHQALTLRTACELESFKKYDLPKKKEHTPTGQVTVPEIEYARQDVRCTAALLNAAKQEFDCHPISLTPDMAFSPASIAKAYLDALGIVPPAQKFDVPNEILGIAMESYTGGRSETRIRHAEVPVAPLDFTSQYPTACALLELMEILTAESLTFEDATAEVRELISGISLKKCFDRKLWREFRFFALVKPNDDLLPVRSVHNGLTQAIATEYLTSAKPLWFAGPDVINSFIQTGRVPQIERAIRVVPHGQQAGMKIVYLRDTVKIDPYRDDLFRNIVEERKRHKADEDLCHALKIIANALYGCFVELNPKPTSKPVRLRVYSGEESFVPKKHYRVVERPGPWYAPYLGSLITAAGRLLLGLAEKCVSEMNGVHAWADTDALAVVASDDNVSLSDIPGCTDVRVLTRTEVQNVVSRFESLNPYRFNGSILNFTPTNYIDADASKGFRRLLGFSIAAKRYTEYERDGNRVAIINPKAHGLGYLYPPADSPDGWDDAHDAPKWIYDAWVYLLRSALRLDPRAPSWLKRPQMMRIAITTQNVLKRFKNWPGCRPYNFYLLPLLAPCGYPADVDPYYFTLVTRFERDQRQWMNSVCINIDDPNDFGEYRLTAQFNSPEFGQCAVVDTLQNLLHWYLHHPESKSLAPTGERCRYNTRGLLQRAHIVVGNVHRIGKDTDRRWEEGDDLESQRFHPIEYERELPKRTRYATAIASKAFARSVREIGIRKLMRFGCGRRTLQRISRRQLIRASTLAEYESRIQLYRPRTVGVGQQIRTFRSGD
ncbi:MAG: hypothetical protein ACR2IF_01410 [Terriglobales bacterium]